MTKKLMHVKIGSTILTALKITTRAFELGIFNREEAINILPAIIDAGRKMQALENFYIDDQVLGFF